MDITIKNMDDFREVWIKYPDRHDDLYSAYLEHHKYNAKHILDGKYNKIMIWNTEGEQC